ncbi:TIGR03089 family protein [Jiangella asiatica]|uniref:TIGR03089 family protein n=1 Tax=Jiangella asiatica TaxID=2530372 RepID=A0A4R5DXT2_9ACTN|nr:TIGR03089 family protein [Jiangella asiatica]TDE15933.1 TIGR03089 family protein [Jiangella asiatica]
MTDTPAELLRTEVRRDGSRPLLTFYDDATGERVELSTTTFDNWVSKTAGLLTDGLDVEPGNRVSLLLPAHWQALAWACACWTVGACVVLDDVDDVRVTVAGPDALGGLDTAGRPGEVVALALRPLGGRFTTPLPGGVLDYAVEVPGYPDRFVPIVPPAPTELGLDHPGTTQTLAGLVERARQRAEQLGTGAGGRLLAATDNLGVALLDALLVPLAVGGSAVLVRNEDPNGRTARVAAERVTVTPAPPGSLG